MTTATKPTLFEIGEELAGIQAAIVEADGVLTPDLESRLSSAFDALGDKVDAYGYRRRAIQTQASLHKERAAYHTQQAKAYEAMEERLDSTLLAVMQRLGTKKLQGQDFTAAISESKRTVVDDPSKVPQTDRYWRLRAPELNLDAIRRDLLEGLSVDGVRLEIHPYVRVR